MSDLQETNLETFGNFLAKQKITRTERIRFSSPMRYNYYIDNELVAYSYDSYGTDKPTYYMRK